MNAFELYATITLDTSGYEDGLNQASRATDSASGAIGAKAVALGALVARALETGAKALINLGKKGVEFNAQMESYTVALTTALGGTAEAAQGAADALEQIKRDAAMTPYSVQGLTKANMLLISAGESAEGARETILALSEAVSATGGGNDELMRMAQNLQQIKNVGKASAMDIRQFAMAGIDVYGILADYTGKTTAEVQEMTISYDMLTGALQAASAAGGRFYGANIAQSKTLNGQLSTLGDVVDQKVGEAFSGVAGIIQGTLLPAAIDFVNGMDVEKLVDGFTELATVAASVGVAIGAISIGRKISEYAELVRYTGTLAKMAGAAAVQQQALAGGMTATEIIAGVLSGTLNMATVSQIALNAAANLFPGVLLAGAVLGVVSAVKGYNKAVDEAKTRQIADVIESDSIEEVSAQIDALRAKMAQMNEERHSYMGEYSEWNMMGGEWKTEYEGTAKAVEELTDRLHELEEAEEQQRIAEEAAAAYAQTTQGQLDAVTKTLDELQAEYEETYAAAYESFSGQYKLFEKAAEVATLSVDDMLGALASQTEYWNDYAENMDFVKGLTADNIGLNADLVASLGDGSAESVAYLASIREAYEQLGTEAEKAEFIENLNKGFEAQQQALEQVSEAYTQFVGDYDARKQELETKSEELVAALDKEQEMTETGDKTITGFITGVLSKKGAIAEAGLTMGAAFSDSFNGSLSLNTPNFGGGGGVDGNHAGGLDYVPFDGYIARLHHGERVLSRAENEASRNGSGSGGGAVYIYPQAMDEATVDYLLGRINRELGWSIA